MSRILLTLHAFRRGRLIGPEYPCGRQDISVTIWCRGNVRNLLRGGRSGGDRLALAALQLELAVRQLSGGDPATVRCRPCEEQNRLCAFPRGGLLLDRGDSCVFLMKHRGIPPLIWVSDR